MTNVTQTINQTNEIAAANASVISTRISNGLLARKVRVAKEKKERKERLERERLEREQERLDQERRETQRRERERQDQDQEEQQEQEIYDEELETTFWGPLRETLRKKERLVINTDGTRYREQIDIVMTGNTQNGKTKVIECIVINAGCKSMCVVSCDNSKAQLNQLNQRFTLSGISPLTCDDFKIKTGSLDNESRQRIKDNYISNGKKLVFTMMNNNTQCLKMKLAVLDVLNDEFFTIEKLYPMHDEGDTVNKNDNYTDIQHREELAKVQKEWISFFASLKPFTDIKYFKRIWISATPENCCMIKNVKAKHVYVLPKKINYRDNIKHIVWHGSREPVAAEVARIRQNKSREIILYCADSKKAKQAETSKLLFEEHNCPVITYNCDGIVKYIPRVTAPIKELKEISIDQVIGGIKQTYNGPIIIVGFSLLSRGISFVGTSTVKPRTATVMFYLGSDSANAVAIVQRIGRITGTSRPDVEERILYTQPGISKCCINYLKNQETIYDILSLEENKERFIADILSEEQDGLEKLGRDVDRPSLKKVNKKYDDACPLATTSSSSESSSSEGEAETGDEEKTENHVKRWSNPETDSSVAKIYREIYSMPGHRLVSSQVKSMVESLGKAASFYNNLTSPNHIPKWRLVFTKDDTYHYISPEALVFANTL